MPITDPPITDSPVTDLPVADLINPLKDIARRAADQILDVYSSADFRVEQKDDTSPLTQADLASHRTIVDALTMLTPEIPILSEESAHIPFETRSHWRKYWLVDPLDGTKEFIKRNGEFTVNIALIERGDPVLGVVWIPVSKQCYYGVVGSGAFLQRGENEPQPISVSQISAARVRVAGSRSHGNEETARYLENLEHAFETVELRAIGSSLKFCLVAEGSVDVYPRFGPTSEWDTAAAQAVVEAAGGQVVGTDMRPLRYNMKASLLNPHFLVFGDENGRWAQYMHPSGR